MEKVINKVFNNLKKAREKLKLTQEEASHGSGIRAKDISQIESGKKKFIPTEYLLFLRNKGYDLNEIFDVKDDKITIAAEPNDGYKKQEKVSVHTLQKEIVEMKKDIEELKKKPNK